MPRREAVAATERELRSHVPVQPDSQRSVSAIFALDDGPVTVDVDLIFRVNRARDTRRHERWPARTIDAAAIALTPFRIITRKAMEGSLTASLRDHARPIFYASIVMGVAAGDSPRRSISARSRARRADSRGDIASGAERSGSVAPNCEERRRSAASLT